MTSTAPDPIGADGLSKQVAGRVLAAWIILPLFFLATGGSLTWWPAWIYCVVLLVPLTAFVALIARRDPAFIARRLKMRENERAQRRVQAWGVVPYVVAMVVPGLDHRFGWSSPPMAVIAAALALSLGGYLMVLRAFVENRWAGRTVETWADQKVVSTGPYAIVRHPMYSGLLVLQLATPVALGSWWAVIPALSIVPILVARIRNEEEVLVRELPGYEQYRSRVRARLVPFLW